MTASLFSGPGVSHLTRKQHVLEVLQRESDTTLRVLGAFPDSERDLKPHERLKSARELAWILVTGQNLIAVALTTGFDWSGAPPKPAPAPDTMAGIIAAFEETHGRVMTALRDLPDERLGETIQFFVKPKTLGDVPKLDFVWGMLLDHIHHRGQFSIYLRLAQAKVPSIYGPTADEPWT